MALLDQYGRPVRTRALTQEIAGPTISGVRSQVSGYPADGLTPVRLANILREADSGDPLRYLELAELIEERDPHYLGVLGTRRRSVSQLAITVKDASDDPIDKQAGQLVRDWVERGELVDELFHILDAIGKGYSQTEIIWDYSEGQWTIERLELRDPRWFRPHHHDLNTLCLIGESGELLPLEPFKMVWLPPFPERHQRANICGDYGHRNGEGRRHERYNDRGRFGKTCFSSARRVDDGRGAGSQEADAGPVSPLHVRRPRMCCCF